MAEMTFTIAGGPGIEVHVEEVDGDLRFTVSVLGEGGLTADLRGFFFQVADESLLGGLTLSQGGTGVTEFRAKEDSVIDLGQGANMQGAASPFDVGVEIGTSGTGRDDIHSVSFVLSHATADLSLSLIAAQEFGVRMTSVGGEGGSRSGGLKLVGTASEVPEGNTPPEAFGDTATTTEDAAIIINVLGNDGDADGDAVTVSFVPATSASGAALTLNADGTISYDPTGSAVLGALNNGQSAADSFAYTISDGHGGTSTAIVRVTVNGVTDGTEPPVDGFLGQTLAYSYEYPAGPFFYGTDVTVSAAVEVPDLQSATPSEFTLGSLNITDNQLIFTFAPGQTFFSGGSFNGIRIVDQLGTLGEITGVSINDASTLTDAHGLVADDISVTADSIAVDFADVAYSMATGPTLILDVFFA